MHLSNVKVVRKSLGIRVKDVNNICPPPIYSLYNPFLPNIFHRFFRAHSKQFKKPSRVQQQAWPAILNGCDVLGVAPTGSGKTLAYLLPAVCHIQAKQNIKNKQKHKKHKKQIEKGSGPIALILVPTRELAVQVCDACTFSSLN
eukprot:GSMAST32.ASY1.ANO1.448.1 assembled CDS